MWRFSTLRLSEDHQQLFTENDHLILLYKAELKKNYTANWVYAFSTTWQKQRGFGVYQFFLWQWNGCFIISNY
jgi:hypothetical protein